MKLFGMELRRAQEAQAVRVEPPITASAEASAPSVPAQVFNAGWTGGGGRAGRYVKAPSPEAAEKHGTVFSCCNNIAGDLSKVPLKLWQRNADGEEVRVRDHPVSWLLNHESSPGVPAAVMRQALIYAYALRGNGYAYAPRDGGGELEFIELTAGLDAELLTSGRARFYSFWDGAGDYREGVPSRSVAHLRFSPLDGWIGRSPIRVAAESFRLAMPGQETAGRLAAGAVVKGVIKLAANYQSDTERLNTARRVKTQVMAPDADGMPVLGPDEDIKRLDLSAADQELLASRKFDREQIAAVYRMPPSKLQMLEHGVKANGEQQAIDYLTDCLLHWSVPVQASLELELLTRAEREKGMFLRHDFGSLLQPTIRERNAAIREAVGGPIMTPNEGRALAGLPRRKDDPEADRLNPAPNMTRDDTKSGGKDADNSK